MATRGYNLGWFRDKAVFYRTAIQATGSGAREKTFLKIAERWCEVHDDLLQASEQPAALVEDESHVLKTWDVKGADTDCMVEFQGQRYKIDRVVKQQYGKTFYKIRRVDTWKE